MKRVFARTALVTWLAALAGNRFPVFKKTPWYRRTVVGNVPWVAPVLVAPFVLFLLWKGVSALWSRSSSETS